MSIGKIGIVVKKGLCCKSFRALSRERPTKDYRRRIRERTFPAIVPPPKGNGGYLGLSGTKIAPVGLSLRRLTVDSSPSKRATTMSSLRAASCQRTTTVSRSIKVGSMLSPLILRNGRQLAPGHHECGPRRPISSDRRARGDMAKNGNHRDSFLGNAQGSRLAADRPEHSLGAQIIKMKLNGVWRLAAQGGKALHRGE